MRIIIGIFKQFINHIIDSVMTNQFITSDLTIHKKFFNGHG